MTASTALAVTDQIFDQCVPRQYGPEIEYKSDLSYATSKNSNAACQIGALQQSTQTKYKAHFRWVVQKDKKRFHTSRCVVPICVGQCYHEGEKLQATLKLVNNFFKGCVILVNDSIQWYTAAMLDTLSTETKLYEDATLAGHHWMFANKRYTDEVTIPYKILRWEHWTKQKDFCSYLDKVIALYDQDEHYRITIDTNVGEFLDRLKTRYPNLELARARSLGLRYLLEECATMCLWAQEKCEFQLYPNEASKAVIATYKRLLIGQYPSLLKEVPYRLRGN